MIICWRDYEEGEFVVLEREFNLIEKKKKDFEGIRILCCLLVRGWIEEFWMWNVDEV